MTGTQDVPALYSQLSLQTWTVRKNFELAAGDIEDTKDILQKAKNYGFSSIEISARGTLTLEAFLSAAKSISLRCSGVHLPCLFDLNENEVASVVERYLDPWQKIFGRASKPLMTTMGQPHRNQLTREYVRILNAVSKRFSNSIETGKICYHLYEFDFADPENLTALTNAGIHLVLDSYYVLRFCRNSGKTLEDVLGEPALRDHVVSTHLNDLCKNSFQHCALGDGGTNWNQMFALFGTMSSNNRFTIEHEDADGSGLEMAAKSYKYLRSRRDLATTFERSRKQA